MKSKRVFSIILFCLFIALTIAASFFALSVNNVTVDFSMCSDDDVQVQKIKDDLMQFEGKNLLVVKEEEIIALVEKDPYMEVLSVEKKLPGKIIVKARERREAYMLSFDDKT